MANRVKITPELEARSKKLALLKIEYVHVDAIKQNTYNPNKMQPSEFSMLKKSIGDDGFTQPVIVQKGLNEIVDGEHRWRAAKELGYTEIPVVFVEMTEAQRRIATLRHNRARGVEDFDLAGQVFKELRDLGALDYAQDALEMDDAELNRMLADLNQISDMGSGLDDVFNSSPNVPGSPIQPSAFLPDGSPRPMQQGTHPALLAGGAAAPSPDDDQDPLAGPRLPTPDAAKKEDVYRLMLMLTGEEAQDVAAVLEPRQASNLVKLCREELERKKKV